MKLSNSPISFGNFLVKGPLPFMLGYSALVLSPLVIARLLGVDHSGGQREWGVGLGMVALMMMLSAFFLSGRFARVNGKAGLDLILKFHRRVVMVALLFAIAHIVMITPFDMPRAMQWVAIPIVLLILNLVLSKVHTKLKFKYEFWRLSHGVFAMIIVASLTMHAISDGRYSAHPLLAGYWIIITVAAILSLFYVHQYLPFIERKRPYEIVDITEEATDQWTVAIEPQGFDAMRFEAGQYAFVSFGNSPFSDRAHPFSFSSCSADLPRITFTIKASGDFTNTIRDLSADTNVYLYGPHGHLTVNHHSESKPPKGFVMLASGVGFTPMMSLLRELRSRNETRPVKVFYACQKKDDVLYQTELENMASDMNLDLHITLTDPPEGWQGKTERFDADYLRKNIQYDGFEEYVYFVCGSTAFNKSIVAGLEGLGNIPVFNIRFEDFSVYS